jgi:hypothetical protein
VIFILGMLVGAIASLTIVLAIIGVPLTIYCYKQMMKMPARVDAWREESLRWNKLWVCKKCGEQWVPGEDEKESEAMVKEVLGA